MHSQLGDEPDDRLVRKAFSDPGVVQAISEFQETIAKSGPSDLSDKAAARVLNLHADYLRDLLVGAARHAKRSQADAVSEADVDWSDQTLRARKGSRLAKWCSSFGGLMAGAGLSVLIPLIQGGSIGFIDYLVSVPLIVVGAILLTISATR